MRAVGHFVEDVDINPIRGAGAFAIGPTDNAPTDNALIDDTPLNSHSQSFQNHGGDLDELGL